MINTKKLAKISSVFILVIIFSLSFGKAFSQGNGGDVSTIPIIVPTSVPTTTPTTVPTTIPTTTPTTTPTTDPQQILIENPLKNIDSLPKLIEVILNFVLKIGTWVLAGFIIYTGYMFVAARGNPAELEKAKGALKYTLIGGAILLGAWVIAEAIVGTIEALK